MIRTIFILLLFTFSLTNTNLLAQNIEGDWKGILEIQQTKLSIYFHISKTDSGYISTMDSPDQGARGIPTTSTSFKENQLTITADNLKLSYVGTLKNDLISGTFTQGGFEIPLALKRAASDEFKKRVRAQDPKEPYSYLVKEVSFTNTKANNIKLAGTLTLPKNTVNPPVAILISGSGPQNRDEELLDHRPFLVLADALSKNGIAVLRYDDRGVAASEGIHTGATSADFATDVEAAVSFLKSRKDVNTEKIGLIGHSEGGLIAPMVASKDKDISFVVLLAGTGVDGEKILRSQSRRSQELSGEKASIIDFREEIMKEIFKTVKAQEDKTNIENSIQQALIEFKAIHSENPAIGLLTDDSIKSQSKIFSDPWMVYFIKTDPEAFLSNVQCPVLAINGDKDFQVISELNLPEIKTALEKAKNEDITIKELKGLNHLFQTAKTGSLSEYEQIEETFAPAALELIKNWILEKTD